MTSRDGRGTGGAPEHLRPLRSVPGYVIEDRIGGGGSAEVYRARVAGSRQQVAIKRIPVADADAARAARAEAALLGALDHPNLVRLHDVITRNDSVILVLDLAAGGSLTELVGARGRLTPGEVVAALAPVGAALAAAHAHGITHGDVTPANVLFTDIGLPLLADLGVARIIGDHRAVRSTPAFVDPTVASGAIPGPASDVFMLAATAVFALTGAVLWPGDDTEQVLAAARAGRVAVTGALTAAAVPQPVIDLIVRALSLEPQRRGTAADFALELRHASRPVGIELTAGRERATAVPLTGVDGRRPAHVPRHAAAPRGGGPAASLPLRPDPSRLRGAAAWPTEPDRPRFERPALTYGVRPPEITALAGRRHRWRRSVWLRRAVLAVLILIGSGATAAGVRAAAPALVRSHADTEAAPPRRASGPPTGSRSRVTTPAPGPSATTRSSGPAGPTRGPSPVPALTDPAAVLHTLARWRQEAFSRRDPALLRRVYTDGALLTADTAMLNRLVPVGCGLNGASTGYDQVRVLQTAPQRVVLTAVVSVSASTLSCPGRGSAPAPAAPPSALRITLVAEPDGPRIADQRPAT